MANLKNETENEHVFYCQILEESKLILINPNTNTGNCVGCAKSNFNFPRGTQQSCEKQAVEDILNKSTRTNF